MKCFPSSLPPKKEPHAPHSPIVKGRNNDLLFGMHFPASLVGCWFMGGQEGSALLKSQLCVHYLIKYRDKMYENKPLFLREWNQVNNYLSLSLFSLFCNVKCLSTSEGKVLRCFCKHHSLHCSLPWDIQYLSGIQSKRQLQSFNKWWETFDQLNLALWNKL